MVFYNNGNMKKHNLGGSIVNIVNGKNTIDGHDETISVLVADDPDLSLEKSDHFAKAIGATRTVEIKNPTLPGAVPPIPKAAPKPAQKPKQKVDQKKKKG